MVEMKNPENPESGLTRTNALLERIAVALEAIVVNAWGVDPSAKPPSPEELAAEERNPRPRFDYFDNDEILAAVEVMEEQGTVIPIEVYRDLGIEPPRPSPGELTEEQLHAPQPQPTKRQSTPLPPPDGPEEPEEPEDPADEPDDHLIQVFRRSRFDSDNP